MAIKPRQIALIISTVFVGCSPAADENRFIYQGDTDREMIEFFKEASSLGIKEITISSFGGRESSALAIADIVSRDEISLTVRGFCTSSCAIYLLPAARSVHIEPNSIIAVHSNSYGMLELGYVTDDVPNEVKLNHKNSIELFKETNTDLRLLKESTDQIELRCIKSDPDTGKRRIFGQYDNWVPTASFMRSVGVDFTGFWPADEKEARSVFFEYFKPDTKVKFGNPEPIERVRVPLPSC